jgi:hypothetical protein
VHDLVEASPRSRSSQQAIAIRALTVRT